MTEDRGAFYLRFTPEDDARLCALLRRPGGVTYDELAVAFDRTWESVRNRVRTLREKDPDLPYVRRKYYESGYTRADEELIASMYRMGCTSTAIAKELGRMPGAIRRKISSMREKGYDMGSPKRFHQKMTEHYRRRYNVRLGSMGETLGQLNLTPEAVEWIYATAEKEGYKTVSEFLVDHMMDRYFEEQIGESDD